MVMLLIWSGFLLTRLRRLAEQYTEVLRLVVHRSAEAGKETGTSI
jgi:hypothetical protein